QPEPLSEVVPGCPLQLEAIVMRALTKDRELRYQSLEDLLVDLHPVFVGLQQSRAAELFNEARDLLNSGQVVEAQAIVRNIRDLDPANREARRLREQIEQSLSKMSAQSRIEANLKAGDSQIVQGGFVEAIISLVAALRMCP